MLGIMALVITILACVQIGKAKGVGLALGVGLASLLVILLLPFGAIVSTVAALSVGAWARNARLNQLVKQLDAEDHPQAPSRALRSDNPFASSELPPDNPQL